MMPETSGILTKVVCQTQEAAVTGIRRFFSLGEPSETWFWEKCSGMAWAWALEVPVLVGHRVAHTPLPKGFVSGSSLSFRAGSAEPLTCKGLPPAPAKPLERAHADPPHDS